MDSISAPEILVLVLVAAILFGGSRLPAIARNLGVKSSHPLRRAVLMFVIGAAVSTANLFLQGAAAGRQFDPTVYLTSTLQSGFVWLLLASLLYRGAATFSLQRILIRTLIVWAIRSPLSIAVSLLISAIKGNLSPALLQIYYNNPFIWIGHLSNFPNNLYSLASATALVILSYFALSRSAPAPNTARALWEGYGGIAMTATESQTTRFLCASAFLSGNNFRQTVLRHFKDHNRAVPPELGVDAQLVARICRFAEKRDLGYYLMFGALGMCSLLLAGVLDPIVAGVVFTLASGVLFFVKSYKERYQLSRAFSKEFFNPAECAKKFDAYIPDELQSALPTEDQNLVVYRGFSPFVGAGIDLGGWSFALAVDKPAEDLGAGKQPLSFELDELYAAIDGAIASIGIQGLENRDYLFVNGSDIREDRIILPDVFGRPVQSLSYHALKYYRNASDPRIRHYKWIRVRDWGNDLVMSYFLRCSRRGQNLFIEIKRFLLTPLGDQYRRIDSFTSANWRAVLALFAGSFIAGPFYTIYAVLRVAATVTEALNEAFGSETRRRRREIRENPLFNYGVESSFRQQSSSDRFVHYFQKLDSDFYVKMLEREILDEIVTFLSDHNIDTSDIKERKTTILNSGIIVQGGDVTATSLAVGAGSTASTETSKPQRRVFAKKASASS